MYKEAGDINFNDMFYLAPYVWNITIFMSNQYRHIKETFTLFSASYTFHSVQPPTAMKYS